MFFDHKKEGKPRSYISLILALSMILSAILPADFGVLGASSVFGDETESGPALVVEEPVEGEETEQETAPPDIVEDIETEITSAYLDDNDNDDDGKICGTLTAYSKNEYRITVEYDEKAGIPDGAELTAQEVRPEDYLADTAEALGWSDEDYILYTKFFDITITKDGKEIEPLSPVTVKAELMDANEGAEAMQVVHIDDSGATELETSAASEAEVSFETESFSVYGFGTAIHSVMNDSSDYADISIYSYGNVPEFEAENTFVEPPEEGFEPSKAFRFTSEQKYWVKADLSENAGLDERESFALYTFVGDKAAKVISEDISADSGLCAVDEDAEGVVLMRDTGLRHLNLEVKPTEDKKVTLDGLMPKEAEAKATDVTDEYGNAIAAYDISILDGEEEYQPAEGKPVLVEITDPNITENANLQVWHIKDNGEKEEITAFTAEAGKISFNARGFSVYEVVEGPEGYELDLSGVAMQLHLPLRTAGDVYFTNNSNNTVIKTTAKDSEKATWYFEKSGDGYYLYTQKNGENYYLSGDESNTNNFSVSLSTDKKMLFRLELINMVDATHYQYRIKDYGSGRYLQYSNSGGGIRFHTDTNPNGVIECVFETPIPQPDYNYGLDGKTYGLAYFPDDTLGCGLLADPNNASTLKALKIYKLQVNTDGNQIVYMVKDKSIPKWTFTNVRENIYYLSATIGGSTKYLSIANNAVSLSDTSVEIMVTPGTGDQSGKLQLSSADGSKVLYHNTSAANDTHTFNVGNNTSNNSWLNLIDDSNLTYDDITTYYSAERISISDAEDTAKSGRKYIIYTRVWDEKNKKYDTYAIDRDGSLKLVYASGSRIEWMDDKASTLEWEFTEYLNENGKPSGYYELYNPFSEKYLAPQLENQQILSDNTIGVQMTGRKNGEYYSNIIAWESAQYAYIGMKVDENKQLVSCPSSECDTFYFAELMPPESETDGLHKVVTLDNNDYGITMKIRDFYGSKHSGADSGTEQNGYLGYTGSDSKQLLSDSLQDNYPTTVYTGYVGNDLGELYRGGSYSLDPANVVHSDARVVNHLFLDGVHSSSGYFEYNSCQNFATLMKAEDQMADPVTRTYKDGDEVKTREEYDFTVYRELGTINKQDSTTRFHGQFLPYNVITQGDYAKEKNSDNIMRNLYGVLARLNQPDTAVLDDSDPRKYEKLYNCGDEANIDYHFGLELEAKFVQTPNGLDDWGHDIIFEFTGDDDFWLYVDGELIIDLGGIHSAYPGKVNFRTGEVNINGTNTTLIDIFAKHLVARYPTHYSGTEAANIEAAKKRLLGDDEYKVPDESGNDRFFDMFSENDRADMDVPCYTFTDYTEHTMRMFYMERGAGASNLQMRFNLSSVTPGHVLLAKDFVGNEEEQEKLNLKLLQYPFQIWYSVPDDEATEKWYQFGDPNTPPEYKTSVGYQGSANVPDFVEKYRPPGSNLTYKYVYFLNPEKELDLKFPDNAMKYRIKECAVNSQIYDNVQTSPESEMNTIIAEGELRDFMTADSTVSARPSIAFQNVLKNDILRSLYITKELYDAKGNKTNGDASSKFNYRLYLSNGTSEDMPPADMHKYYVRDGSNHLCRWDASNQQFISMDVTDIDDIPAAYKNTSVFETSMYGSISNIPAGYTVEIPDLIMGTRFYVEERDYEMPVGYKNIGYECKQGENTTGDSTTITDSYKILDGMPNKGEIQRTGASNKPTVIVKNRVGAEITANKIWTDKDIADEHDTIYAAVYLKKDKIDGEAGDTQADELKVVKQLKSPNTEFRFFFDKLDAGTTLSDYYIREVTLSTDTPTVGAENIVNTDGITVTPLAEGDYQSLHAKIKTGFTVSAEKHWSADEIFAGLYRGVNDGNTVSKSLEGVKKVTKGSGETKTSVSFAFNKPANATVYDYFVREITFNDSFTPSYDGDNVTVNNCTLNDVADDSIMLDNVYGTVSGDIFTINAEKHWDDDEIYVGIYLDDELLEVRKLTKTTGRTAVTFDYNDLPPAGYTVDDYSIREVKFIKSDPSATDPTFTDNTVNNLDALKADKNLIIKQGNLLENQSRTYKYNNDLNKYTVSYTEGSEGTYIDSSGNVVTIKDDAQNDIIRIRAGDTITNARDGGIGIRLFKWASTDPLKGGKFRLTDVSDGNTVKEYTSDANGLVTVLYADFTPGRTYILEEPAPPTGYMGLSQAVKITVGDDGTIKTVVLTKSDGSEWTETDWATVHDGNASISKYIDVYNKQYSLTIKKVDVSDNTPLQGAKFNLYKGMEASDGGGIVKALLTDYTGLTTNEYGEILLLPLNGIGKILKAGTYFLRETEAPPSYTKLTADIEFVIDAFGFITGTGITSTVEDGTEKYVLTVTNSKDNAVLNVTKEVKGSLGNKAKPFTFTIHVEGASGIQYPWTKNGVNQTPITLDANGNGTFALKSGETAAISGLPRNVDITVSENNEDYSPTFAYDGGADENVSTKTFRLVKDETDLVVTNTRSGILPTGVAGFGIMTFIVGLIAAFGAILIIRKQKRA